MSDERPLTESERARLSNTADWFQTDLAKGPVADWEPYLAGMPPHLRQRVLAEMVMIHLDHGWGRGQGHTLQFYLRRYPELGPEERVPGDLIVQEYRARLRANQARGVDDYRLRFPAQFDAIRDRLLATEQEVEAERRSVQPAPPGAAPLRGFELVYRLGGGAFADVWQVRSPSGIEKAMKVVRDKMDKDAAQRELAALERIKNLRNPYILRPDDFFIEDNRLHIVYELANGTLRNRMDECTTTGLPGIPADELFEYVRHSAAGLDYLHEHELIHRDIKPDNILLFGSLARVADFGLLRKQEHFLTNQSILAGTMAYMAPEVWQKQGGPAADQYSLAVAYAELRQGKLPVELLPYPDMMFAHLDGHYRFEDTVPDAEREVIRRALARNPSDRFPTCREFVNELARATGQRPIKSGEHPKLPPVPPRSFLTVTHTKTFRPPPAANVGRQVAAWAAILVLAGVLLFLIGVALFGGHGTPTSGDTSPTTNPDGGPPTTKGGGTTDTKPTGGGTEPTRKEPEDPALRGLPKGTVADGVLEDIGGKRKVYDGIRVPFPAGGKEILVRFRLVPGVQPFYLTEEKVWNGLARGVPETDPSYSVPAFNLSLAEATAVAKKFPGGRLPTADEWTVAAGSLKGQGEPWVNKPAPSPSRKGKTPGPDVNEFGLLDMAGNGGEWTSTTITGKDGKEYAVTRGRQFTFEKPLTKKELDRQQGEPMTAFPDKGNPYTGFRVVIPVPDK